MTSPLVRILALARLVMVDGLRRHALIGLVLLALAVEVSGLFFFSFVPRDIGRVSTDYVVSIGWLAGMVFLLFHAVGVMSWGEDRRVIHTILARPLSRAEYVLGVFAGLFFLLVMLNLLLGGIGAGILLLIKSWVGDAFFDQFKVGGYLLSWLGVLSVECMILSAIVLFSGLLRGGFVVFLVSLSYYLVCTGVPVAIEFFREEAVKHLLVGLTFIFPNFSRFDYKGLIVAYGDWPPAADLGINLAYVALYCGLVLFMAAQVYGRRDLK